MPVARYWDGAAWVDAGVGPSAPARVSALPGSPVDGQEVYYVADATNGVLWHLRYNAGSASAYKWEFLGGPELVAEVLTSEQTASATYAALATAGPSITVPLVGDYDVSLGANLATDALNAGAFMSFDVGATAAVDNDAAQVRSDNTGGGAAGNNASATARRRKTGIAAASALVSKYRTSAGTGTFIRRWLRVQPVRVGYPSSTDLLTWNQVEKDANAGVSGGLEFIRPATTDLWRLEPADTTASHSRVGWLPAGANNVDHYLTFYFRKSGNPSAIVLLALLGDAGAGSHGQLRLNTDGTLTLVRNTSNVVGSNSAALSNNVWHRLDLRVRMGSTTALGQIEGKLNGTQFAVATGVNLGTALLVADLRIGQNNSTGGSGGQTLDWTNFHLRNDAFAPDDIPAS